MLKSISTILLLLFLSPFSGLAAIETTKIDTIPEVLTNNQTSALNEELIILRAQNKLIKTHQGSLLNTVYWSLGVTFTIFITLLGLNIWSNMKLRDADIENLKEHFSSIVKSSEDRVELRLEEYKTKFIHLINNGIRSETESLNRKLESLNENYISLKADFTNSTNKLKEMIFNNLAELREVEEELYKKDGNYYQVLLIQLQAMLAASQANNTDNVVLIAKRLKATLEKYIESDMKIPNRGEDLVLKNISELQALDLQLHTEIASILSKIPKE